ncbi:type III secretion protein V [Roseateles sp. YR242]|uniref:flagellar biosynthesis protein FlhA n=1 Tax=Roseateles sp. YR242 TaxID=1855305 RepID=UPI0008B442CB|nr:flagellar biosynthesis protein FlhA [Roseateles sp. YR242]SEK51586.1 type III secretion protein V [Roseateles sp. YR242]
MDSSGTPTAKPGPGAAPAGRIEGAAAASRALASRLVPSGERAEIVVTILVVAVVFAMLLPVPLWMLDLLIAVNLCTSAFLIVLVLQIKHTTGLSAFPSLFLVTTLFRVALSVASTRQILLSAEAGHIIAAFGEIVVGGNLVVGLVVFLVLTVVQFIVITKGSERVAEVGARFSLDAMPGRQMAIDMERKSGGISQEEATAQRDMLTEESQFFGAMDGTMKFAKGDAIVGIVIVLVNLIGGLAVGVLQRDMAAGEALKVYAILTVGDGLVAQIPALLMSMTAGLLVTRVSKPGGAGGNIGKQLTDQLLAQPKAWVTASGAMVAFGLLPGMPLPAFLCLAGGSAAVGLCSLWRTMRKGEEEEKKKAQEVEPEKEFDIIRAFVVRVSDRVEPAAARKATNLCRTVRNDLLLRIGLMMPPVYVEEAVKLDDVDLEFCHGEVRVFGLKLDESLMTCSWLHEEAPGVDLPAEQMELRGGMAGSVRLWLSKAQISELSHPPSDVQDCWERLRSLTDETLTRNGPSYFGIEECQRIVAWTTTRMPEVAKELERALPLSRMSDVFRRLLSERVSIRNLPVILNALIDWGPRERDPAILTECIRSALQREICESLSVGRELRALMLESELESTVRSSIRQTAYGDFLALDAQTTDGIVDRLSQAYLTAVDQHHPTVVICAQDIRAHVRKLLADRIPEMAVIGMSELPPDYRVNVLTVVASPAGYSGYSDLH